MEQGVWQEIEQLYQKFQKLGISESVDYDKYYLYSLITHSTAIEGSTGQRNNLRDFFFGPPCFSAKIELHFTLNYAAHVNQDVNRKSMDQRNNLRDFIFKHII